MIAAVLLLASLAITGCADPRWNHVETCCKLAHLRNDPEEARKAEDAGNDILRLCVEVGGCLTGEHGVGIEKRDLMRHQFTQVDLEQQMRVRAVFDHGWRMNPAKVFPLDGRWTPASEAA